MKKISFDEAKKLIESGQLPICNINFRTSKYVRSLEELQDLKNLESNGIQQFELYEGTKNIHLPSSNAMQLTFDDAFKLFLEGESIYRLHSSGKEEKVATKEQLLDYQQQHLMTGEPLILYWYV